MTCCFRERSLKTVTTRKFINVALSFVFCAIGSIANAQEASNCISVSTKKSSGRDYNSISNTCNFQIGLNYCHPKSDLPGTQSTQCENNGRYYQQFTTLQPYQATGNPYSAPGDVRVEYAACRGTEGNIRQTGGGNFVCKTN